MSVKARFADFERLARSIEGARVKWNECNLITFGFVMGGVSASVLSAVSPINGRLFLGNDGRLQWETLLTGFGAVLAAFFTIVSLKQQIRQTEQLAESARQRRLKAARAMLPLALSELAGYATSCIKGLYDLRPYFQADGSLDRSRKDQGFVGLRSVHLSDNVYSSLKECIEFMDDAPATAAAELIRHLQIQRARLTDYMSRLRLNDRTHLIMWANIDQGMRDAAEIHARVSTLFPFARGQPAASFSVTRNRVREALWLAGCFRDDGDIDALANKWKQEFLFRAEVEEQRTKPHGLTEGSAQEADI
jgi:hypothetical protein